MAFEFDGQLKDWVGSVIKGVDVSLAAPGGQKPGQGVGVYLLEVAKSVPPSTLKPPPLQLNLRYLITAWSEQPEEAHRILVELIFAAMEKAEFQVELDPIPLTVWTAFGLPPQPSFILRVPLRQERPQPHTKLVREPLRVQVATVISFHGVLLGPGNAPLSDCRVEMPALSLSTNTDYKGRFHFPSVPAAGNKQLLIKAKGFELPISSERNYPDSRTPLVIHFSPLEE